MNTRIQELAKAATTIHYTGPGEILEFDKEQFAELVIQDVVNVLYENGLWSAQISQLLFKNFGVC